MNSPIMKRIHDLKLVPVVVIEDARNAAPLAEALIAGGLPCAEVTFRTAAAIQSLRNMAKFDDLCLGAGTVLSVDQVKAAIDAGARYIVTPGFNADVVGYCVGNGIPVTPGVATPTDIELGLKFGLEVLKFFPAEPFGGLKTLKAISAPYGMIKFIPTGGISEANVRDYLALNEVFACGGSWMVRQDLIDAGRFDEIASLTRRAVDLVADL